MNLSSLKSSANGSSSIFETVNPPEKEFVDSKSFRSKLSASCSQLDCFLLRILINKTTSRATTTTAAAAEHAAMMIVVLLPPEAATL